MLAGISQPHHHHARRAVREARTARRGAVLEAAGCGALGALSLGAVAALPNGLLGEFTTTLGTPLLAPLGSNSSSPNASQAAPSCTARHPDTQTPKHPSPACDSFRRHASVSTWGRTGRCSVRGTLADPTRAEDGAPTPSPKQFTWLRNWQQIKQCLGSVVESSTTRAWKKAYTQTRRPIPGHVPHVHSGSCSHSARQTTSGDNSAGMRSSHCQVHWESEIKPLHPLIDQHPWERQCSAGTNRTYLRPFHSRNQSGEFTKTTYFSEGLA